MELPGQVFQSLINNQVHVILPRISENFDLSFANSAVRFSVYCLAFCFEFEWSQTAQNKSSEKYLYTKTIYTLANF